MCWFTFLCAFMALKRSKSDMAARAWRRASLLAQLVASQLLRGSDNTSSTCMHAGVTQRARRQLFVLGPVCAMYYVATMSLAFHSLASFLWRALRAMFTLRSVRARRRKLMAWRWTPVTLKQQQRGRAA